MDLSEIKVGDEVAVLSPMNDCGVEHVERLTPTQIILKHDRRFWKKNGRMVGCSDSWRSMRIKVISDDIRETINEQTELRQKRRLHHTIVGMSFRHSQTLTVKQLKAACVALGLPVTHKD